MSEKGWSYSVADKPSEFDRCKYEGTCECGKVHTVYTQPDEYPEYYTDVSISCACGKFVIFTLPVN